MTRERFSQRIKNVPRFISRLGLVLLISLGFLTFWLATSYINAISWRTHTTEVLSELRALNLNLHTALAHHRSYIITPHAEGLKKYAQAKDATRSSIYRLSEMMQDNHSQMDRLERVATGILSRLSQLESTLQTLKDNRNATVAANMVQEDIRQVQNYEVAALLEKIEKEERRLLAEREEQAKNHFIYISISVIGGLSIAFCLFFFSTFLWQRELRLRIQAENDLQESNKTILRGSDMKTSFLTNMSHEIRTPLNGITGMTKLLEHTELSPQQFDYVETIKTSTSALLALINDILDLSKIESGKFHLEEINFEMRSLIDSTISIVEFAAKAKKLRIETEIEAGLPEFFIGDPLRLRQVLLNLINNAIKFSEQGSIIIRISARDRSNSALRLTFEVIDQGIGFDNETKERLFKTFSQGDDSTSRKYGGSGLGLSISKQIVEMMNGRIDVESIKGVGSKFFFEIPLKIAQYDIKPDTMVSMRDLSNQLQGYILIAEDNRINQKVMSEMVTLLGCRCHIVANGREVLSALRADKFDLILMDGQMPVMDGYESTRLIRAGEAGEKNKLIPILATSANAIKGDVERCLEAGMNDYISKPIAYTDLSQKLEKWLRQGSYVIDEAYLDKLRSQEHRTGKILVPELIDIFTQDTPPALAKMRQALLKRDLKSVRGIAHNLKTSAAILGAVRFKEIAERMERAPEDTTHEQMGNLLNSLDREYIHALEVLKRHRNGESKTH